MPEKNKFAVIYVRQPAMEAPEISGPPAEQEMECRRYTKKHGYTIVGIFRDISDEEIEIDRAGFELMLDFIADGGIQAVILSEREEFPENLESYGHGPDPLKRFGVKLLRAENQRE